MGAPSLTGMDFETHRLWVTGIKLDDGYATIMSNYNRGGIDEIGARAKEKTARSRKRTKKGEMANNPLRNTYIAQRSSMCFFSSP